METGRQNLVTILMVFVCIALAAFNVVPRLHVRQIDLNYQQADITVAIAGAINQPGSYQLPWGSRLEDLLVLAGGLSPFAEASLVNLAMPLDEGATVVIPFQQSDDGQERISLNNASAAELQQLSGVGAVTAERIIRGRPYHAVEDLLRVRGIGEKTLERLRDYIKP